MFRNLLLCCVVLSATLACLLGGIASAAPFTITTGYGMGADAYISQQDDTFKVTNFGTSDRLSVRSSNPAGTANDRYAAIFLRFDLSDFVPGSFSNAQLDLTFFRNTTLNVSEPIQVYGLNDGAGDFWIEGNGGTDNIPTGELTYANAPGILQDSAIGDGDILAGSTTHLGTLGNTDGITKGDISTLIGAALDNFLNADTNGLVTLILQRDGSQGGLHQYASKETIMLDGDTAAAPAGTFAPALTFNATPTPEPASVAMWVIGGLLALTGVIWRSRKQCSAM